MELTDYIKYCLGYIKLTRHKALSEQQKNSVVIPKEHFSLLGLLNGDLDGNIAEPILLSTFYALDPKNIPNGQKVQYEREKQLANKVEDIYNASRNDQFTKQVILSFGYFEVELPLVPDSEQEDDLLDAELPLHDTPQADLPYIDESPSKPPQVTELSQQKGKVERYPLFAIPVLIEKVFEGGVGKYLIYAVDPEVQVNLGVLEPVLGNELYFQLIREIGDFERNEKLSLPFTTAGTFVEIWQRVKAQLKLREAVFDEQSFLLEELRLALSTRSNYFLAEDLRRLSQLDLEHLKGTALTSWTEDSELNEESGAPEEHELYFPFKYDKFQLRTLTILKSKASVIEGPPGTGKSETISNLLCHLAASGKKVLFVSQKAQALKVVKDKLRALKVKYLFGYIPNPGSSQLSEQDEEDGIAPQLTALKSHIESIGDKSRLKGTGQTLEDVVRAANDHRRSLTGIIDAQRHYWGLHKEAKELSAYSVSLMSWPHFTQNFSGKSWASLKELKALIGKLEEEVRQYQPCKLAFEWDRDFTSMDWGQADWISCIEAIHADVTRTGYDGSSVVIRATINSLRRVRCWNSRSKLPREFRELIDWTLHKDISKSQAATEIKFLLLYARYQQSKARIAQLGKDFARLLNETGLSSNAFKKLEDLLVDHADDIEPIKKKILRLHEVTEDIRKLQTARNPNEDAEKITELGQDRTKVIARYMQTLIDQKLVSAWKSGVKIRSLVETLAKAFGKSKKAYKTFDKLRQDPAKFLSVLELIPVWIMELDDASRIIPLNPGIFDYVILDEASQCNIAYTLPVMFRAHRAVLVGDSEQMRDSTVMFRSNRAFDELAHKYQIPDALQIKATGTSVQSVLEIATYRGFLSVPLRYHYRSPAELIGFSNKFFYKPKGKTLIALNNNYLAYSESNRVMLIHQVPPDLSKEFSDKVNVGEAELILKLFRSMRDSPLYDGKSVGILSFFNAQATYIRRLFQEAGFLEDRDNYKVSIVDGIQGDEKDVVLYSFVLRGAPSDKKRYQPLTGEGGDIIGDINRGRVNVAFSRARLQTHCFLSLPISEVPDKIWIKKYLQYVQEYGDISHRFTDLNPFDSYFEEEFYAVAASALGQNYKIQNQVKSCGFKIDFAVTNTQNGKQIAVECDGPTHFEDEIDEEYGIYVEDDEERQRVLMAAGWRFYRVKYSDWITGDNEKDAAIKELRSLLS